MKFVLFVEGHTERRVLPDFLKRWLDPQMRQPVGIQVVQFEGWPEYVAEIAKKVSLNLSGPKGNQIIAAVGLLDLYGPTFYPAEMREPVARYTWAKQYLEQKVAQPKFHQHFAVHEIEAWLLASASIFPEEVRGRFPGRCMEPERVNFREPPKRLLDRLYRQHLHRSYKEVTDGANLFQSLSPDVASQKCPFLRQLLDEMLQLAREAGL